MKKKLRGLSPQANYTDRATERPPLVSEVSANLFADSPFFRIWDPCSQQRMFPSFGTWRHVVRMWTDVSEESITSIYRVEISRRRNQPVADAWAPPPKRQLVYGLHCFISQKMATSILSAVRTSNSTLFTVFWKESLDEGWAHCKPLRILEFTNID
jgi:hypothetical protein